MGTGPVPRRTVRRNVACGRIFGSAADFKTAGCMMAFCLLLVFVPLIEMPNQ
jgi:hypothetical protein